MSEHERRIQMLTAPPEPVDHDAVRDFVMACDEPCVGMVGEWTCLRRATTAPTVLCDRCERLQQAVEWAMARARVDALHDVVCVRTDDAHLPDDCVLDADDLRDMQRTTEADAAEKWEAMQ